MDNVRTLIQYIRVRKREPTPSPSSSAKAGRPHTDARTESGARNLRKILISVAHRMGHGDIAEDLAHYAILKKLENADQDYDRINSYCIIDGLRHFLGYTTRTKKGGHFLKNARSIYDDQGKLRVEIPVLPDECAGDFERMIAHLKPEIRQIFRLRFVEGWTAPEIAESLGKTLTQVNNSFKIALDQFRGKVPKPKRKPTGSRVREGRPKRRFLVKGKIKSRTTEERS